MTSSMPRFFAAMILEQNTPKLVTWTLVIHRFHRPASLEFGPFVPSLVMSGLMSKQCLLSSFLREPEQDNKL